MLKGLIKGREVHYIAREGDPVYPGTECTAKVVNDWASLNREDGCSNLTVFPDWSNDGCFTDVTVTEHSKTEVVKVPCGMFWAKWVTYSIGGEPGTWHWPQDEINPLAVDAPMPEAVIAVPEKAPETAKKESPKEVK